MSSAQYEKVEDEPAAEETEQKEADKVEDDKEDAIKEPPPGSEEQQQKAADDQDPEEAAKPSGGPAAADQTATDIQVYKPPRTWLIMSIVVLILFPFHVFFGVNIFFSVMAMRHIKNDNLKAAKRASKMAFQLNGIAILLGIITYIAFFGMAFYV